MGTIMSHSDLIGKPLKYVPTRTFAEAGFFKLLSDLKLNKLKLNTDTVPISGFMNQPQHLTKFQDHPILNLDASSVENVSSPEVVQYKGTLLNVNTIEEFKATNKLELLRQWGTQIHDLIVLGDCRYSQVNQFFVLTFCDLKKYKFYYWFAFPSLQSLWTVADCGRDAVLEEETRVYLELESSSGYFLVRKDNKISPVVSLSDVENDLSSQTFIFVDSCRHPGLHPGWQLKNYLWLLAHQKFNTVQVFLYRSNGTSLLMTLHLESFPHEAKYMGWERTAGDKLGPKMADLGSLIDPVQLADQAVDLNLKLMKWRISPKLDLELVGTQRVLLLGSGTLGSYVARALMGWGVRHITFVDNGRVSYSNPVRQPLYSFNDCFADEGLGVWKAQRAAEALKEIFPGVNSSAHTLEVPMAGHPTSDEQTSKGNFQLLERLVDEHDVIYLLMDSRESRWLPTLLGAAKKKLVINAALGFDSFLVMRHGTATNDLGCYYCNDVVAPTDSLSDRTLDQMCTVTRPGGALMASAMAVELMVSVLQHPDGAEVSASASTFFGDIPHQVRGFLNNFHQTKLWAPKYPHCSACSQPVVDEFRSRGWSFVRDCLNDSKYLERVCGLEEVQREAERASQALIDQAAELELDDEWLQ